MNFNEWCQKQTCTSESYEDCLNKAYCKAAFEAGLTQRNKSYNKGINDAIKILYILSCSWRGDGKFEYKPKCIPIGYTRKQIHWSDGVMNCIEEATKQLKLKKRKVNKND